MEESLTPVPARPRRGPAGTPLSGGGRAQRTPLSTPRSVLTPNDDAAEKATARKRRQAQRMRKSLAGSFEASAGGGGVGGADGAASAMSEAELRAMLDLALKLAAENKITDRNVWSLPLIDHLPDMVHRAAPDAAGGGTNYFTRISGGLDAGVQIYARRVEATYKLAYAQLQGAPDVGGAEGSQDPSAGSQDAGADGAKRRRRGGAEPREEDTLADAASLRMKPLDGSFVVDPLFHRMSQIFDEDGAAGMLLLNRGVYRGSEIMFESGEVPEDAFPLAAPAEEGCGGGEADVAVNLAVLRPLVQALERRQSNPGAPRAGSCAVIAPSLRDLYKLLGALGDPLAAVDEEAVEAEVAEIMAAVEADCVRFPAAGKPARSGGAGAGADYQRAARIPTVGALSVDGVPAGDGGAIVDGADASMADEGGAAPMSNGGGDGGDGGDWFDDAGDDGTGAAYDPEAAAAAAAETQRQEAELAARLAEQYAPGGDAGGGPGCEGGAYEDDGDDGGGWDAGGGDDGASSDGGEGPGGAEGLPGDEGLEGVVGADGLPLLLSLGGGVTRGTGWAGSSYWRFQRGGGRPDAPHRRAGAGSSDQQRGGAKRGRRAAAEAFIDFESPPPLPPGALAPGTAKQTMLSTLTPANTLLPEDMRYEAAALARLFLKPSAAVLAPPRTPGAAGGGPRQQQQQQQQLTDWAADPAAAEGGGSWGDGGFGGGDDGDDDGGCDYGGDDYEGEGAGGFGLEGEGGADLGLDGSGGGGYDQDPEHELLQAPRRVAALGVGYSRASKQVDVHALKDIIWQGLAAAEAEKVQSAGGGEGEGEAGEGEGAKAGRGVDFRSVIRAVPDASPAGRLEDMSVHMCFICLLHLANQHGLEVRGAPDLRTLTIRGGAEALAAAGSGGGGGHE